MNQTKKQCHYEVFKNHSEYCSQHEKQHLYLQGWLAVGHCGRSLSTDNDRHMEAVVGQSSGSTCYTEGLSQGVPRFLAENRVHQLDDLVLGVKHIFHQFQRKKTNTHTHAGKIQNLNQHLTDRNHTSFRGGSMST